MKMTYRIWISLMYPAIIAAFVFVPYFIGKTITIKKHEDEIDLWWKGVFCLVAIVVVFFLSLCFGFWIYWIICG